MKIQSNIIPTLGTSGVVTIDNVYVGARVRRGPDWVWWDQDRGRRGVVVNIEAHGKGWVQVNWGESIGNYTYSYRAGVENAYDLIFAE